MKRVILFACLLIIVIAPAAQAQERGPLAMRIAFEWSAVGGAAGAFVGFALWLTDPGNPHIKLSAQLSQGAALGIIGGTGYSFVVMQRSAQLPVQPLVRVKNPFDPAERLTTNPMVSIASHRGPSAIAFRSGSKGGGFTLPLFRIRF